MHAVSACTCSDSLRATPLKPLPLHDADHRALLNDGVRPLWPLLAQPAQVFVF
jgi:hypothetical protein